MITPVMPTYARYDVAFVKGEGAYLYAEDGRRYLDFGSGVAVTALGHAHPHLVAALTEQAGKVWHTSNLFHIPDQERLARRLTAASFADTAFFCNSGAEALEGAIKIARKYQSATGHPERFRMITFEGAFHGRTLATLAAGGQAKHLAGFGPKVDGFDQVTFGNLNETRAAIGPETAGILVEPILGEGGVYPAVADFLRGLRAAADEFGLLLIFDEVQTGMGRTGTLFAHQAADVAPDVMALAKGLGGGFPIGAILATEKAAIGMTPGTHGSTFGGNPLASAVANAVLDIVEGDGFLDHVREVAAYLRAGLEKLAASNPKIIKCVRGEGLLLGVECVVPNGDLVKRALDNGLVTIVAGGNVVRLLPPLIIEKHHVDEALEILARSCAELAN
ncbi:MAG: aspartate aminotransferase family protein [Rhodospirillales bacterium]|nr:aspartate aminotransferase family protein [Rhodospirillales bacterium]MCW8861036.1 aspartate aminotransferase family protein [Rhodospirillales bacterium]